MVCGVVDAKLIKRNMLIWFVSRERHDRIDEEAYVLPMACQDEIG
jgi:hypothetical protein